MCIRDRLDVDKNSLLTIEELCALPEVSMCPLLQRVLMKEGHHKNGEITVEEFVRAMSVLSPRATLGEKLKLAYSTFDVNDDGVIQPREMFAVFRVFSPMQHDDSDLQQIVDAYMKRFPDGLTYEVFSQMFCITDLAKLTLNV